MLTPGSPARRTYRTITRERMLQYQSKGRRIEPATALDLQSARDGSEFLFVTVSPKLATLCRLYPRSTKK